MNDLRTAAQQALKVLEAGTDVDPIFAGETEVALRAALAQQVEPQGCATEEDCTKQPWCRIRGECQRKQAEPLNLRNPAVQKRLATQWGYVPAAQAEPVEPVAHRVVAGALFDFMGWLTSRRERLVLSSTDDAAPAADAIKDFAEMRGLSLDDAKVQDWDAAPPQRKPLTEEEIESCRQKGYAHAGLSAPFDFGKAARAVERAVWEKNHG